MNLDLDELSYSGAKVKKGVKFVTANTSPKTNLRGDNEE